MIKRGNIQLSGKSWLCDNGSEKCVSPILGIVKMPYYGVRLDRLGLYLLDFKKHWEAIETNKILRSLDKADVEKIHPFIGECRFRDYCLKISSGPFKIMIVTVYHSEGCEILELVSSKTSVRRAFQYF